MLEINFGEFPVLTTQRLQLTQFELSDAPDLFALRSHPDVLQYLDAAPAKSEAEMEVMIESKRKGFANNEAITWAIREIDSQKFVGSIGFWKIDKANHRAEIGYMTLPEFWGKGYVSELFPVMLDFAFETLGLHGIDANTNAFNLASQAVLTKFGFQKEAHFRENWYFNGKFLDSVIFCVLARDWQMLGK